MSYTEFEFTVASDVGIPRLVFLLEDSAPAAAELSAMHSDNVEPFRRRLREADIVVVSFRDAGELKAQCHLAYFDHPMRRLIGYSLTVAGMGQRHSESMVVNRSEAGERAAPLPADTGIGTHGLRQNNGGAAQLKLTMVCPTVGHARRGGAVVSVSAGRVAARGFECGDA
jgi:hypothetical protein